MTGSEGQEGGGGPMSIPEPGKTKPCDACPGTLAYDESAEEWYHVESAKELNRQMVSANEGLAELDDGNVLVIDGETGVLYVGRLGDDEFRAVYDSGLRERESRYAIRTLLEQRDWQTVSFDETPIREGATSKSRPQDTDTKQEGFADAD